MSQWECEKDPNIQSITTKIQNVTTVPKANYESFQILRYDSDNHNIFANFTYFAYFIACW